MPGASVEVERAASKVKINIYTARPGIVMAKRGAGVETLKKEVQALTSNECSSTSRKSQAETNAQLVAENVATQPNVGCLRPPMKKGCRRHEVRRQGIPWPVRAAWAGPKWPYEWYHEGRVLCTPCARTSNTASPRRTRPRCHRGEVLDLQRRGPSATVGSSGLGARRGNHAGT